MMATEELTFPELIEFSAYGGNFKNYFDAVYAIFHTDFIKTHPQYEGLNVSVRKYPEVDGMHRTFYHITHEGEDEANRQPDIRRMERIRFPKFVIQNKQHNEILIWKNKRGKDERIVLFNEQESYVLILTNRGKYFLFITAYLVEKEHRKRKLIKEYEAYIKTKTA